MRLGKLKGLISEAKVKAKKIQNKLKKRSDLTFNEKMVEQSMDDVLDLVDLCRDIPVMRVSSGEAGKMFLDAILRMIDGLTEAAMLLLEAMQNAEKTSLLTDEAAAWAAMAAEFTTYSTLEGNKKNAFSSASKGATAVGGNLQEASKVSIDKPAKPAFGTAGAIMKSTGTALQTASSYFAAGVAPLTALATECTTQSGIATSKAATHSQWMILDIVQAAIKIAEVVIDTISWAMQVIGVPAVPEIPKPVCGWDIIDPYEWFPGQLVPEIIPEPLVWVENMEAPVTISQGPNVQPMITDYIEDEEIEYPMMDYDGGGTVFNG